MRDALAPAWLVADDPAVALRRTVPAPTITPSTAGAQSLEELPVGAVSEPPERPLDARAAVERADHVEHQIRARGSGRAIEQSETLDGPATLIGSPAVQQTPQRDRLCRGALGIGVGSGCSSCESRVNGGRPRCRHFEHGTLARGRPAAAAIPIGKPHADNTRSGIPATVVQSGRRIRPAKSSASARRSKLYQHPPRSSTHDPWRSIHMPTGTVKWFSDDKGFGFITPDDGDKDLFVHHTGINGEGYRSLQEGAKVSYDPEQGDKGPKAVNVSPIDSGRSSTVRAGPRPRDEQVSLLRARIGGLSVHSRRKVDRTSRLRRSWSAASWSSSWRPTGRASSRRPAIRISSPAGWPAPSAGSGRADAQRDRRSATCSPARSSRCTRATWPRSSYVAAPAREVGDRRDPRGARDLPAGAAAGADRRL